ncbi:hypothetical protein EVAR_49966_1 [Eumeta japonica]|uniref:Uncharacterized protein n=1 Tax=Eumeta variegata TaxID=151549 RepID=A0A4C1YNE5_EUMVA|nr:hypothetical protein EVAR_49966_1 [Eumeta japonica]
MIRKDLLGFHDQSSERLRTGVVRVSGRRRRPRCIRRRKKKAKRSVLRAPPAPAVFRDGLLINPASAARWAGGGGYKSPATKTGCAPSARLQSSRAGGARAGPARARAGCVAVFLAGSWPRCTAHAVSLYREQHSIDIVFGRRLRMTFFTQIASQISATTFELVKPVITNGKGLSFIMIASRMLAQSIRQPRLTSRRAVRAHRRSGPRPYGIVGGSSGRSRSECVHTSDRSKCFPSVTIRQEWETFGKRPGGRDEYVGGRPLRAGLAFFISSPLDHNDIGKMNPGFVGYNGFRSRSQQTPFNRSARISGRSQRKLPT